MKVCKPLWEAGMEISVEECRKWLNYEVEGEFHRIGELLSSVEPYWKVIDEKDKKRSSLI